MIVKQSKLIEGCYVTDSSGCHRYDYWNEQALFDRNANTGWCTPSRTQIRQEFLEIDLGGLRQPSLLRLQARPIKDHPGFPKSVRILARSGAEWRTVLLDPAASADASQWWEGRFAPLTTSALRLEFDDVGRRSNGSYFLQFMQLEVLEEA